MKKFRKIVSIAALTGVIGSLLVGCGSGGGTEKSDSKKETADGKKIVKMYITGYESDTFKPLYDAGIAGFEKENPDIKVEVVPASWEEASTKLLSLIQAGETPDVIMSGTRELRQLSELDALAPLDEYMTDEFKSKRVESVLNTANINGTQYGIPLAFSSKALYYRKDLIPEAPKTWEELEAVAKKVTEGNEGMNGFALATDIDAVPDLLNFFYQNGGRITDDKGELVINSEENIETLDYLKKLYDDKLIPNPVDLKRTDVSDLFKNGKIAMFVSGPWEKDKIEGVDYGVALLPKGKEMAETLVTDSYAISSLSENKEEAWKLIETMGKFEYQNAYDEAIGFFPILKEEEGQERYSDEFMKPFAEMIQHGVAEPHVPKSADFQKGIMDAVKKVMMGEASSKEALDELQNELSK